MPNREGKIERIRDPIHNLIEFDTRNGFDEVMWNVIESPEFQRLRRIKQLGFTDLVYPGASHSRFAHSLGVFHTARRLMDIIEKDEKDEFDKNQAQVALAACLVHDVGHGPFSHAFEDAVKDFAPNFQHELISKKIILRMKRLFEPLGSGFANDVARLVASSAKKGGSPPRTIYHAVVSSQFDADRLDYMRRDRIMAGSLHGAIDYDWLLANLEIHSVDNGDRVKIPTFVVGRKAVNAAEAYVVGLFQLYPTIYFHKTTRSAEAVLVRLLQIIFRYARLKRPEMAGLPANHPLVVFANTPENLDSFLALDDTVIWGSLWQIKQAKDATVRQLATALLERRLMRCFDVRDAIQKHVGPEGTPHEMESHLPAESPMDRLEKYIDVTAAKFKEKVEAYCNTQKCLILDDHAIRKPYEKLTNKESNLNQIRARDQFGRVVDLGDLSPIVAAVRDFKVDRFYVEKDDDKSWTVLEDILKGILEPDS